MSFLSQPIQLFSIGPTRSFGGISGYVTIQEQASDVLEITQQPVQQGASIADHAFKKPTGFSISMLFQDNLLQSLSDIYDDLLTLQDSLQPFNCVTPKRTYYNMLFASLGQTTDKKTENCLAISAVFQEVIFAPIVTTVVPKSQLRSPKKTLGVLQAGNKSAIKTFVDGIGGKP